MQVIVYGMYAIGSRPLVCVCEGSGGVRRRERLKEMRWDHVKKYFWESGLITVVNLITA